MQGSNNAIQGFNNTIYVLNSLCLFFFVFVFLVLFLPLLLLVYKVSCLQVPALLHFAAEIHSRKRPLAVPQGDHHYSHSCPEDFARNSVGEIAEASTKEATDILLETITELSMFATPCLLNKSCIQ
jgi:hypothetical protein